MKYIIPLFIAAALTLVGCEKHPVTVDDDPTAKVERKILYSVNDAETRTTFDTEAEWDAMLDQFCEMSKNGYEVVFYNLDPVIHNSNMKSNSKDTHTITTSSSEEIKEWMKTMEKDGLTVKITYDKGTGTWNGIAYATAPANNTSNIIIGMWRLDCMVVAYLGSDDEITHADLFEPEEDGNIMYYTFNNDGTMTLTVTIGDSTYANGNSTWSLSNDGVLSTDLLPSGGNWNVNWITNNTLILSHRVNDTPDGDLIYQLQFEAVTTEK
jgi:hypothetical protein